MLGRLLIVEDDEQIADILREYLMNKGYEVNWASTGNEGLEDFKMKTYDLLIVDIMLPGMDGYSLCQSIRWVSDVPILIISARNKELDKIKGLKIGADDYVTKPFSLPEVEARIESLLRRYKRMNCSEEQEEIHHYEGGLSINFNRKQAYLNEEELNLTATEWALLTILAKNPQRPFTKKELYEHIWHEEDIESSNTITVHIKQLRNKLKEDSKNPKFIETAWGIGYRFIGGRIQ